MAIEINVPDIGADEVEITEILVKVGDKVEAEQSLITVEGDKASMEVPSPQAGVVKEIKVSVGDKTETGKLIMIFDSADGAADAAPAQAEEKKEENISGGEFGANDEVMEKSAGRKTILIAEDIQSNYQLVSTILKDHYDLLHAENGQKAVEIARSQHVDLLLMDMKMPVLDGLKATAEIRKFNASLPIVALTAHAFDSDRIAAIKVGCNEYLVKPLEKMKLMVALKKYL